MEVDNTESLALAVFGSAFGQQERAVANFLLCYSPNLLVAKLTPSYARGKKELTARKEVDKEKTPY